MNIDEKLALIKRNTEEIVTEEELKALLSKKEQPSVYLGTAVTGRPHVGYFVWVLKLADFLKAGFKVKLLIADIHGALDNCPWSLLDKRYSYYEKLMPLMFDCVGANADNFEMVKGSSFQMSPEYFHDILKVSTEASVHDCKRAGSEVVKQSDNPKLAGLIYPIMQALDEQYLGVDIQYGGVDQRKILMFAREYLPKVGYDKRVEVMTPLIPGLIGEKMSASNEDSKIDLLDDSKSIKKKLNKAFCPEGEIEGNGVLAFAKNVLMVIYGDQNKTFDIKRPEKFGGDVSFKTYKELEKAFVSKKIHPLDLKNSVGTAISELLKPFEKHLEELNKITEEAYPKK